MHRSTWAPPWAKRAVSHPAPGVWVAHPLARLALYRDGRLWWLSRIRHASDEVVVHGTSIAFTVYGRVAQGSPELWMAHPAGHEFLVGAREEPVGWTAGGLVTAHGNTLRVRGPDGVVYRTLGRGHSALPEPPTQTVVFVSPRGELVRTDGRHTWRLAAGFGRHAWVQRLDGGVLDVTTGRRSVFLRADGTPLGIVAPLDEPAAAMGEVIALPHDGGVVFVVRKGLRGRDPGVNVVYVTRPHSRPRRVYARRIPRLSCGEYASVSYFAGRVLYVDDEGPIAVLDPSGRRPPLDLTRALRVLQPPRPSSWELNADWAPRWR